MTDARAFRLTPWVTRLIAINGLTLLLLSTVFTAPRFVGTLMFEPTQFVHRPWTVLTYAFVPASFAAWTVTTAILALFGPPVERRLGGRQFAAYYIYCAAGAALLALGLGTVFRIDPFVGASGAAYGIGVAYILFWPNARIGVAPASGPLAAGPLLLALIGIDLLLGLLGTNGIAQVVHIGGGLAGYAFFRLQAVGVRRPPVKSAAATRRAVVTPMHIQEGSGDFRPASTVNAATAVSTDDDVDRLLDKISQFGLDSLTSMEQRTLREAAERKRREQL